MYDPKDIIDWNSPDALLKVIQSIQAPLTSIIEANNNQAADNWISQNTAAITLENSKKIAALIQEVVNYSLPQREKKPLFFEIYQNNPNVQAMCSGTVDQRQISKLDKEWLLYLEKVVFNEPNLNQLSLFALAFEVSVSERQLHRNIKKFLKLTPNKYIRVLKLHKAKQLIEEYAYRSISEVAFAVGFRDAHYFSNLFYKQYGAFPKDLLPV